MFENESKNLKFHLFDFTFYCEKEMKWQNKIIYFAMKNVLKWKWKDEISSFQFHFFIWKEKMKSSILPWKMFENESEKMKRWNFIFSISLFHLKNKWNDKMKSSILPWKMFENESEKMKFHLFNFTFSSEKKRWNHLFYHENCLK